MAHDWKTCSVALFLCEDVLENNKMNSRRIHLHSFTLTFDNMHRGEFLFKRIVKRYGCTWFELGSISANISGRMATLAHARVIPCPSLAQVQTVQGCGCIDSLVLPSTTIMIMVQTCFSSKLTGLKANIWQRRCTASLVAWSERL